MPVPPTPPDRDPLRDLRRRKARQQADSPPEAADDPSFLRNLARRHRDEAPASEARGAGIAAVRDRLMVRQDEGAHGPAESVDADHLQAGLVRPEESLESRAREIGLPLVEEASMQPRRPYGRLAIAVFLLAIIGVLALNLAPLPAVRLPPESQVVARFHSLAVNDRQLQAALQLVYAYDPKSVLRAVPRVRELLARLPAGTSRLEFQGSPRQVRPGVKAVDVREIFRTANETRQSDLTVILQQEEAGCLIHAHLSSPLIWEDPDRLPRPPDTYFATPLQAVLNACHLATDEEAWWRLIPRLARLG